MLLTDKVAQFSTDSNIVHDWVHGPASGIESVVTTENGPVRTPARLIADQEAAISADGTNLLATTTAQAVIATTQAGIATTQAGLATTNGAAQVVLATTEKTAAVAAKTAAELARDAALIQAGVYVDEPTGRAAVADGVAFKVQGTGDIAAYEYRRVNAGTVSTLIATYPSTLAVQGSTARMSGLYKQILNNAHPAVLSVGNYLSTNPAMAVDIFGWRSAFVHNGQTFDSIQLTTRGGTSGTILIEILNAARTTVLAYGLANVTTSNSVITVPLNKLVTSADLAASAVGYVALYDVNNTITVAYPAGGVHVGVDTGTYPDQYWVGFGWITLGVPNGYMINFRLMNMSASTRNFADEITAIQTNLDSNVYNSPGKINGWPDTFFRITDLSTKTLLGRERWWSVPSYGSPELSTTLALVPNVEYDGNALRVSDVGGVALKGPVLWMDDMGLVEGDVFTLYFLVTGTGGVFYAHGRFLTSSGSYVGAQTTCVTVSGGYLTTSGTPTFVRGQFTVPANVTRLGLYPYVSSGYADIQAMWCFKGDIASGPSIPSLSEFSYPNMKVIIGLEEDMALNSVKADYVVADLTEVGYSSKATVVGATGAIGTARNIEFSGWCQQFNPSGTTFNAIRLPEIKQTVTTEASIWRELHIFVRTGATPQFSGDVIARGSVRIDPTFNVQSDIIVPLRDPITGEFKSLSDADISSKYIVAVWASNAAGNYAACGESQGTMSNSDHQSGYFLSAWTTHPEITDFGNYSGDVELAFEHLYLTDPISSIVYVPSPAFIADLAVPTSLEISPEMIVPQTFYGLVLAETNIYHDNIIFGDYKDYVFRTYPNVYSGTMQNFEERFKWIPQSGVTSGSMDIKVISKLTGAELSTATINLRAAVQAAGTGMNKKILVIGDSLINSGVITDTLLTIAASDPMDVTTYGTRGTAPNKHEGRGGWRVDDYTTFGRTYYRFTVTGVITPPVIWDTYSHNGTNYYVDYSTLSGGAGTITCFMYSGSMVAPTATGTLTKIAGTGDASIPFTVSAAVSGNPFWIGGAVNFSSYLINNGFPAMDWVIIQLGINDTFGQTTDVGASGLAISQFASLDTLIASIKASDAGTRVALMIPSPPSYSQDSFAYSEGTNTSRYRFKRNILLWAKELMAKYNNQEANRIYVIPSNVNLDVVNNMSVTTGILANSRSTVTVTRQTNGVHPAVTGYQQLADAVWAFLKYYA